MSVRGGCLETELAVFTRLMNVNFLGVVELTRCLVPGMLARPAGGHVVVVSSVQGRLPVPHRAAYTASKHAVQAWADSLRAELSHTRVAVTVISPGYVDTNLSRNALNSSGRNKAICPEQQFSFKVVSQKCVLGYYPIYRKLTLI